MVSRRGGVAKGRGQSVTLPTKNAAPRKIPEAALLNSKMG